MITLHSVTVVCFPDSVVRWETGHCQLSSGCSQCPGL